LQLLDKYDVFVCYCEETGITWAENVKKILEKRGYKVYVAHMLRSVLEGKWREIHDNIIRKCKIFIFINTMQSRQPS
jgi:predicted nucleotidyltransferase